MNRLLLIVLAALFLTACAGRTVKDDSPASDLLAFKANAHRTLKPRTLPNGKLYCLELAKTEEQQDDCGGDLEDTLLLSEGDKHDGLLLIDKMVERLTLARNPCGFWANLFRRDRCKVEDLK